MSAHLYDFAPGEFVQSQLGMVELSLPRNDKYIGVLHAVLDERGKFADSNYICLALWLSDMGRWVEFAKEWRTLLSIYKMDFLHTKDFMRPRLYHRQDKERSPDEKKDILRSFMRVANNHTTGAGVVVVSCADFAALKPHEKQLLGNDPSLFAFHQAMAGLVGLLESVHWRSPVGLCVDDEEKYSIKCYELIKDLQRMRETWRKRLKSICFTDDEIYEPLQAADLYAWLVGKKFETKTAEWDEIISTGTRGKTHPTVDMLIYEAVGLKAVLGRAMEGKLRKASEVYRMLEESGVEYSGDKDTNEN